ncbi:hypothetical protein GH810_14445 [Acetobacterium paludosum]|uniref:Phage gp6-like head-tail connector protein n=1 Tax=Acetobacterium paludosum TaxID=52693 RepID=A0A923HYI7_9FIRM|nr:phage head-tail connector protein [Acetobacterium paludosum]MBC3889510.1 hypothetical protein [Acetobacterium paludosum]
MDIADNALMTLADLKSLSGIANTDTSNDVKLQFLINSASQEIENILGRKIKKSQYTEKAKGNNRLTIKTKNYPLLEVAEIKTNGSLVNELDYSFEESGIIEGIRPWGASGLQQGISNFMVQRSSNIEISYTAGYILPKDATTLEPRTLPYDLELSAYRMINGLVALTEQGTEGLKSFSISDVSWTWDKEYMQSVLPTILRYREVRI